MITNELIVVRHGESTWNAERRWAGQADPPLTERGRRQAAALAEQCRDTRFDATTLTAHSHHPADLSSSITAVVTSDLCRARETGLIVASALGLAPPTEVSDLRERWSTTFTGQTEDQIEAAFPGALSDWRDGRCTDLPGDSEPFDAFAHRIMRGLSAVAVSGATILVVAHAGVLRALGKMTCHNAGERIANAAGRRITIGPGGVTDRGPAFAYPSWA